MYITGERLGGLSNMSMYVALNKWAYLLAQNNPIKTQVMFI